MNSLKQVAADVFSEAMALTNPAERRAYLDRACAGNQLLRTEVESLLLAHEQAGDFLGQTVKLTESDFVIERTGTMIGRYKLLEKIGEGGFGVVYMAEQIEPLRRKVALKVIKAGMDTQEVIARFEAERQALALMDHPNIARVLDAGATEAGRPYFVMELVRGIPITNYCDQKNLSTTQRLQLFMKVCHAVQHAHQKGIIHRDLKPNNVLVTLHDGEPVPKVIDFGVAKALGPKLTAKTLFTGFAHMIGTPEYMSPEQAELSGLDIDTRSDIYSLGVLLYELLTGDTPFDGETLRKAALDEMRRMIRETEPPKPSTRLQTLGNTLTSVARHRQTEPATLRRLVRGDLDWIVMKALEKDRRRRYETPDSFASDVARHLHSEPVLASPPSVPYLVEKFMRRHKAGLAVAAMLLLLLIAGAAVSTWQAVRATRAERTQSVLRQQAEQARANERQLRLQAEAREKIAQAEVFVRNSSLDEAAKVMRTMAPLLNEMDASNAAAIYFSLGDWHARHAQWNEAVTNIFKSIAGQSANFEAYDRLAPVLVQSGDLTAFAPLRRQMLSRFGEMTNPVVAERVVNGCLILPWAGAELDRVGKAVDTALKAGSNHWAWNYIQVVKGLAEYRAGHFASAVDWLQAPLREQGRDATLDVENYMVLAMAHHQMGYHGYARDALTTGLGIAAWLPSSENDLKDWKGWNDWIIAQSLIREAKELIEGPPTLMKETDAERRTDK
jgi:serine/threonine protein kinase/tetratricopeptide (TPR) repeat protein